MTTEPRLRVAIVGCGRIAQTHAGYLKQTPHVELVGACDVNPAGREAFTNRWQVPTFASIDEMMDAARPQAVHLVTPPSTHPILAEQLLNAGQHVLIEKPMAFTAADVDGMLATAQRNHRYVTANHNRWFDPVVQAARRLVISGKLGDVVGVDVFQGAAAGEADAPAGMEDHWTRQLPGGVLFNLAPHPVYLLSGFTGKVEQVQVLAQTDTNGRLRELRATVAGSQCLGSLTISLNAKPFMNRLVLYGTKMTAEVNLNNMTLVVRQTRQMPKLVAKVAGKVVPNFDEAWQMMRATVVNGIEFVTGKQRYYPGMGVHFAALYAALADGAAPPISGEEAREAVWLLQRIWEAAGVPMQPEIRRAVNE